MMLKKLRLRLAAIFTAFTGVVLATALGISLAMVIGQIEEGDRQMFQSTIETVVSQVHAVAATGGDGVIIEQWPYSIYIVLDGNDTMVIANTDPPGGRAGLFDHVRAAALEEGSSAWVMEDMQLTVDAFTADAVTEGYGRAIEGGLASGYYVTTAPNVSIAVIGPVLGDEGLFTTAFEGVAYRATYFTWPVYDPATGATRQYEVGVMEDLTGQRQSIAVTCVTYGVLFVLGLAVLMLINWLLAKLVLRPTEEGLRRQTEFVAAASHELRNPLAVIRGSLSAAEATGEEAEAKKFRAAADAEAERMGRLVDDLLLLAGSDSGSWKVSKGAVDMDTLLIETGEQYAPLARARALTLRLDLPEQTLPVVQADRQRLRQILGVLLDNALQYAPEDTEVVLGAKRDKNRLLVWVADSGAGVADEDKERVFLRFYRADKGRSDKKHFGLGLSVAKELAEKHGGDLSVIDTPGGGATFVLRLPAGR